MVRAFDVAYLETSAIPGIADQRAAGLLAARAQKQQRKEQIPRLCRRAKAPDAHDFRAESLHADMQANLLGMTADGPAGSRRYEIGQSRRRVLVNDSVEAGAKVRLRSGR
jgi:hypothetical protein